MPRLAWFTPLPPIRSGIAAYNAELLPILAPRFDIDVYVDPRPVTGAPLEALRHAATCAVFSAHDFVWKHQQAPYHLIVYQLGNATWHEYMWPYVFRYPGLAVMHDGQLHHARAKALLGRSRQDDYRAEFAYSHPDADRSFAEFGVAGFKGSLYYFWPMIRGVVDSSIAVAVHSGWLARDLGEQFPHARIEAITMGVPDPAEGDEARFSDSGRDVRHQLGVPADAFVFAAYGLVTPEKRIIAALDALANVLRVAPASCLLLVGDTASYFDVREEARTRGVANRVFVAGYVEDERLPAYIAAADVCLSLRWPSSRETSASWLRSMAGGKPTIITDLIHTTDVPTLDPRNWQLLHAPVPDGPGGSRPLADEAVAVSIDILDEDHSLGLAMQRLATDRELCHTLGRSARAFWQHHHTLERMRADYVRLIEALLEADAPVTRARRGHDLLPAHLRNDGRERLRQIAGRFGIGQTTETGGNADISAFGTAAYLDLDESPR